MDFKFRTKGHLEKSEMERTVGSFGTTVVQWRPIRTYWSHGRQLRNRRGRLDTVPEQALHISWWKHDCRPFWEFYTQELPRPQEFVLHCYEGEARCVSVSRKRVSKNVLFVCFSDFPVLTRYQPLNQMFCVQPSYSYSFTFSYISGVGVTENETDKSTAVRETQGSDKIHSRNGRKKQRARDIHDINECVKKASSSNWGKSSLEVMEFYMDLWRSTHKTPLSPRSCQAREDVRDYRWSFCGSMYPLQERVEKKVQSAWDTGQHLDVHKETTPVLGLESDSVRSLQHWNLCCPYFLLPSNILSKRVH